MNQTADYVHEYAGRWNPGGVCRIRFFEEEGLAPVVVCSELPENTNASVQGMVEYLAAEVIRDHLRLYTAFSPPFVWVEHFPRTEQEERWGLEEKFSLVTFASYTITTSYNRGAQGERPKFGQPSWAALSRETLEAMIGGPPEDATIYPREKSAKKGGESI